MPQSLKEGRHYRVREDFSERQRQVLDLLVRGQTNREIAEELAISLDGAKYHVSEVITKLGVDSREEAAEWWRQQHGLRARLRVLTRGLSVPAALRWAGMGGGAMVLVGIVAVVAVAMSQDGGGEPDPVQQTPEAVETEPAVATEPAGTPGSDDGEPADNGQPGVPLSEIGGVPVRELRIGGEVDLPAGSVLYYNVTCYACGPGLNYHRAYINGEGQLIQEPLSPFFPPGNLHSLTIRPGSSTMLLHMCTGGYCQQGWSLDEGTTPHTYVSVDGGVTWSQSTPPLPLLSWILGFHQDGWLVRTLSSIDEGFSHDDPLWVYPSGQVLTQSPSHPKSWPLLSDSGEIYWSEDVSENPGPKVPSVIDGAARVVFEIDPVFLGSVWHVDRFDRAHYIGAARERWPYGPSGAPNDYFVTVDERGSVVSALYWPAGGIMVRQALNDRTLVANALYPDGLPDAQVGGVAQMDYRAVIIDLENATVHSIRGLSRGFGSGSNRFSYPVEIVAGGKAVLGVDTDASCLNVREEPSLEAGIIRCYVDGVLLFERDVDEQVDGWVAVRTPDGHDGWASEEFLLR